VSEYVVKLPDVGEGIAEAEIVEWHVNPGDTITEDQVMVEVMTDKATVELPSPVSGVVLSITGAAGDIVSVGSPLIRIETNGGASAAASTPPASAETTATAPLGDATESQAPLAPPVPEAAAAEPPAENGEVVRAAAPTAAPPAAPTTQAPTAAPAVRQRAKSLGIDLATVAGSGPDGRIVHGDLDAHLTRDGASGSARTARPKVAPTADAADDSVDEIPVIGLRRNIAQRMQIAKTRIPHFTYVEEVDVSELERLRAQLNQDHADRDSRLTVLPFLMRAVVVAIRDFPQMNARYDDDNGVVKRHHSVHLGVATQTAKGLMVPVVKHANDNDLWASADEVARLSTAARNGKVTLEELSGSTITITSLGALGGIVSTPIINYPEVAIIGVNKILTRPVYVDGAVVPRQIMNLSSSFDHRVVDGADAAAFIQRIKALLETPALLFID
jgi:2-oxoisovalerate dehydrogenase E2 component (dihydrolipoyl transacylase)